MNESKQDEMILEVWRYAFHTEPTLERLLMLYQLSYEVDTELEELDAAIENVQYQIEEINLINLECKITERTKLLSILALLYMFKGEYSKLFELYQFERLGEELASNFSEQGYQDLGLAYFMLLVSNHRATDCRVVRDFWRENHIIVEAFHSPCAIEEAKAIIYEKAINIELSDWERYFYLQWCIKIIDRQLRSMVKSLNITTYEKEAKKLVACKELIYILEEWTAANYLMILYHYVYSKKPAFQDEVIKIKQTSLLLGQDASKDYYNRLEGRLSDVDMSDK